MKPINSVFIHGYGAYVPLYRIKDKEILRVWEKGNKKTPIDEKSVINLDEDTVTLSVEAARYALRRSKVSPLNIGAIFVGTESPPYAVKPIATIVSETLGSTPNALTVDMEFACKAATTALIALIGMTASHMIDYGLVVGTDTSQGRPGDELEYTVGCGAGALIIGWRKDGAIAEIKDVETYNTDTPDFWRREGAFYPSHAQRFTGEPAYFHHIANSVKKLLDKNGLRPKDFKYVIFHQPNIKFPLRMAKYLGFKKEQLLPGLVSNYVGNTYAAVTFMGLSAVFDIAKPGDKILLASFGSGAGSDAFYIEVLDEIESKRSLAPNFTSLLKRKKEIDYALYLKYRNKIKI